MKHDAWMKDLFWGQNSSCARRPLEPKYTCICAMTVHVKMWRAAGASGYTPRQLPGNSNFWQAKKSICEVKKKRSLLVLLTLNTRGSDAVNGRDNEV